MAPRERAVLKLLNAEAREVGATLLTGGRGGLPPSLVLGVFRRDKYRCKRCGTQQDLTVHHKGGLDNPVSAWLADKGKRNDFNNLVVACAKCHQAIHDEDKNVPEDGA
jgi:5-methylcytosine-specific restriction endonuclease McrA